MHDRLLKHLLEQGFVYHVEVFQSLNSLGLLWWNVRVALGVINLVGCHRPSLNSIQFVLFVPEQLVRPPRNHGLLQHLLTFVLVGVLKDFVLVQELEVLYFGDLFELVSIYCGPE